MDPEGWQGATTNSNKWSAQLRLPDVASRLQPINTALGIESVAVDLENKVFPNPIWKEDQKQFPFTWGRKHYTFLVLPPGCINYPTLHSNSWKGHGSCRQSAEYYIGLLSLLMHHANRTR